MTLSYLVTCKNDGAQLETLLSTLRSYSTDCECIVLDDYSDNPETIDILNRIKSDPFYTIIQHALNSHYGDHKNFGKTYCKGDYIFQIDSDEMPSEFLLTNVIDIIKVNDVELIWVPRINDFAGLTSEHAAMWGWKLTDYEDRKIANFPDYQSRIFKNIPSIGWNRPLHEKIEGNKTVSFLPAEYEFSLHHIKTIEKQIATNIRYNKQFSAELNKGYKL
jgi:glycosyltransferase involved in cell wall biosynthesis